MLVRRLHALGVTSDMLELAALGSIAASILTWRRAKSTGDIAHAERFGIFIGLWAPTFVAFAEQLTTVENAPAR